MYLESDLLMLSGLQHVLFCERQWALIHIEQQWVDNIFTAMGNQLHEKVHSAKAEHRGNIRLVRTLRLVSYKLGLVGQADMVEFHRCTDDSGVRIRGHAGYWKPYPVEYKRGKPKKNKSDEVQLCAQAICLEEMLKTEIDEGALFYGKNKRRTIIEFDDSLRKLTENTAQLMHELFRKRITPAPDPDERCTNCSLNDICLPQKTHLSNVKGYLHGMIRSTQ